MDTYSEDVERKMKQLFAWLSEKDRRRYAAAAEKARECVTSNSKILAFP